MKKKVLLILIPLIVLLSGVASASYYIYNNTVNVDTIYTGIQIDEKNVGGMTKEEAYEFLSKEKELEDKDKAIQLKYEEISYTIKLQDIGYGYDFDAAIDEAFAMGRDGGPIKRYKEVKNIEKNGIFIPLESHYDKGKIEKISQEIAEEMYVEEIDATFNFNGGKFKVTEDSPGRKVDEKKLSQLIEENIGKWEDIEIPVDIIEPKYTKEYYSRINGVIGEFSTDYSTSIPGRKHNIRLSAGKFNGKLLHPGDSISYNKTLGPITKAAGYKEASVIENGEFVTGVGGGICQTSTTLYNALLQAGLTIVQRSPHSIPIGYVPKGTDAAVAAGWKDLVFKNDYDFPVYLTSKNVGDRVYFQIYGDTKVKDYQVRIESKIVETIKHKVKENYLKNARPGYRKVVQTGRDGYKVKTYKYKIKNGKVIESKQISYDYYRERDAIVEVGPKKEENKPKEKEKVEANEKEDKGQDEEGKNEKEETREKKDESNEED